MQRMHETPAGAFNRQAAAQYLDLSPRTIDALAACGDLPYVKVGVRVLFRRADLDSFLASRVRVGRQAA